MFVCGVYLHFHGGFCGLGKPAAGTLRGWGQCIRFFSISFIFNGVLGVLGNLGAITNLGTLDILGILGGGLTLQSV